MIFSEQWWWWSDDIDESTTELSDPLVTIESYRRFTQRPGSVVAVITDFCLSDEINRLNSTYVAS